MRAILLTAAAVLCCLPLHANVFEFGYDRRKDTLNYSDEIEAFERTKIKLNFLDASYFAYTKISSAQGVSESCVLHYKEISSPFEFILGHYQISFGSGLYCGKKKYQTIDLFSQNLFSRDAPALYAVRGGNPLFAFMGPALFYKAGLDNVKVETVLLYSYRERYIELISPDEKIGITLPLMLTKTILDNAAQEAVSVHDAGFSFMIKLRQNFQAQMYFLATVLTNTSGETMVWSEQALSGADSSLLYGSGLFLSYKDQVLETFLDIVINGSTGTDNTIASEKTGAAVYWGLTAEHPLVTIKGAVKYSNEYFYAPYSSERAYPENFALFNVLYKAADFFHAGMSFTSRDYTKYSGVEASHYSLTDAVCSFYYSGFKAALSGGILEEIDQRSRHKIKAAVSFKEPVFSVKIQSVIQWNDASALSWLCGISLSVRFGEIVKLMAGYVYASISDKNYLYAQLFNEPGTVAAGQFMYTTSHTIALQLNCTVKKNRIFAQWKSVYSNAVWDNTLSFGIKLMM